jgi:hypothetical protein
MEKERNAFRIPMWKRIGTSMTREDRPYIEMYRYLRQTECENMDQYLGFASRRPVVTSQPK